MKKYTLPPITVAILFFLVAMMSIFPPGCAQTTENTPPQTTQMDSDIAGDTTGETRIVILHVNDLHSKIDNFAKLAWLIQKERNENPNVFLFNAGDNFSGNPIVDQYEPKGEPIMVLLNKLGVDVQALGNHEFDYGQELLAKYIAAASYPILCANIKMLNTPLPQLQPFTILKTKNGIKIAVLSLLEISKDNNLPSSHPMKLTNLEFTDGLEAAKKYTYLRNENEVFIGLTHLGFEVDERLAEQMGELDLIVGGHSHTTIKNPVEVNGVLITQTGSYARYLGKIQLTVKGGRVISKKAQLIDLNTIVDENPEIKAMIQAYNTNPIMDKIVATLPFDIQGRMEMSNLITDAIRYVHKADISFHNEGGTRSFFLEKEAPLKSIFKILPFGNDIIQFKMTAAEITGLIKYDFLRHKRRDLQVSGLKYTIITDSQRNVKEITVTDDVGQPLNSKKRYNVAMNDYIASSYKFSHADAGHALQASIAQTLIDYLSKCKPNFARLGQERTFEKEEKE